MIDQKRTPFYTAPFTGRDPYLPPKSDWHKAAHGAIPPLTLSYDYDDDDDDDDNSMTRKTIEQQ